VTDIVVPVSHAASTDIPSPSALAARKYDRSIVEGPLGPEIERYYQARNMGARERIVDRLDFLVVAGDLDSHLREDLEDPEHLIRLSLHLGECLEDVVGQEIAQLLALDDQALSDLG